jgi:iron complex transport system substrate-binding protein
VALSGALAGAILILALSPPTITTTIVSSDIVPAKRALILDDILSGYATINGGADHILAVSKRVLEWGTDERINRIYPSLARIPVIGSTGIPDPEQILYLQPDAVFVYIRFADFLKKLGLPGVFEVRIDFQHPIQSREEMWMGIGKVTGKSNRARALAERYKDKRRALQRQLLFEAERRVRAVYVQVYPNGSWWTTNSGYYLAYKLELAGAINAAKDLKFHGAADLEQLLLLDPDVILFVSNPGDRTTAKELSARPEFRALRAVRERRTYELPSHAFMNEPVEDPLLLTWMAEVFYPEVVPRRLRDEYKETYQEVYHYAISDDEIDRAICLEENRYSAGYERFVRQETRR